jgi:predicted acylesterase/phospholipase RssA
MAMEPDPPRRRPEFAVGIEQDKDFEPLLRPEMAEVGRARPAVKKVLDAVAAGGDLKADEQPYTIGLALSGGGIRSATVSLGVMQRLAKAGILKEVDYLSTVSGGGYIGAALTWWLNHKEAGRFRYDTGARFPFGITDPKEAEPKEGAINAPLPLQYLRVQGKYLSPGNGITVWSGLAITLRSILLNLLVWVPIVALAVLLLLWFGQSSLLNGLPFMVHMLAPQILTTVSTVTGAAAEFDATASVPPAFLLMFLVAGALFVLYLLGSFNHSLLSWTNSTEATPPREAGPAAGRRRWYNWLLTGAVGLIGLAILAAMAFALKDVAAYLFARDHATASAGYQPGAGVARDIRLLVIAAGITLLLHMGWKAGDLVQHLSRSSFGQLWRAVIGLAVLAIGNALLWLWVGPEASDGWKIAIALVQFTFGMGFLAYANYVVGLIIRHLLRYQPVGGAAQPATVTASYLEYQARRVFEWFYGGSLKWIAVLAAVGLLPLISSYIDYRLGGLWTAIGVAITFAGQLRGRFVGQGRFTDVLLMVGAAVFAYGVLLIGYRLALTFLDGTTGTRGLIAALFFVAAISGWFANTNHTGLHRFYRDRLMEAFLPDAATLSSQKNGMAPAANEFRLAGAWTGERQDQPYHIVNTNLVLSNSETRVYRLRGGDNFILSPLHIGSSATGWRGMAESENADITLASAMAISGAAANPRGGPGGRGPTRSPSVAIAMSLLNIRLGYWIRNPKLASSTAKSKSMLTIMAKRPNHFWPGGAYAISQRGYREDAAWVELADGGHFENLAIYELVRRRCGLIIVCDGGQDNASSYADLVTAVQRIGRDFGAVVRFDMSVHDRKERAWEGSSPARLIAKSGNVDYPKGVEFAEKGYLVASINYGSGPEGRGGKGWPKRGTLIYLKSALIKDLDIRAKGYRGANVEFPNQSTGDQFFDEEQFEAYREVGYRICEQMMKDLDLEGLFGEGRPAFDKLAENDRFKVAQA